MPAAHSFWVVSTQLEKGTLADDGRINRWRWQQFTLFHRSGVALLASVLLSLTVLPLQADTTLSDLRTAYLEADRLLSQQKISAWLRKKNSLKNYPLYHYLVIKEVRQTHSKYSNEQVAAIISRVDVPLPNDFKRWWLQRLKDRRDWELVIRYFADSRSTETKCTVALAMLNTRTRSEALRYIEPLWLVGHSQPKQCDPLFNSALGAGIIDDNLIWQRLLLSAAKNQSSMTKYLRGLLASKDLKTWVGHLENTRRNPRTQVKRNLLKWSQSSYGRDVITFGMKRITRADSEAGVQIWQTLKSSHPEAVTRLAATELEIARILGWRRHPEAYRMLANLPTSMQDSAVAQLMVRNALAQEDWSAVLAAIKLIPPSDAQHAEWQYWRARALFETGDEQQATTLLTALASHQDYYGFLAADQMELNYNLAMHHPSTQSSDRRTLLDSEPGIARIREWLALRKPYSARRELSYLNKTRQSDHNFWRQAALMFHSWGWHDGAIRATFTSGRPTDFDVSLSHPSPYLNDTRREAIRNNVPPHWILGIMRQESLFVHDIRSGAGAIGLMQLMPATARSVAKRNRLKTPSTRDLSHPPLNIRLGTNYFRQLLDRTDDNPIFSLAGYNAGPRNVEKWRKLIRVDDPAVWVEAIPYRETRNYIKKILVNFIVYEKIHHVQHVRIRDYLKMPNTQHAAAMGN